MALIDAEYLRLFSKIRDHGSDSLEWRKQLTLGLHRLLKVKQVRLLHARKKVGEEAGEFQYVIVHPASESKRRTNLIREVEVDPLTYDDQEAQACLEQLQALPQNRHTEVIAVSLGQEAYIAARIPHEPSRFLILRFESVTEAAGLTQQQLDALRPLVAILAESHATSLAPPEAPSPSRLPPKRREVFEGILQGSSDTEIAQQIGIAHDTVRGHVREIYNYFEATSRSALLAHFASLGRSQADFRRPKDYKPRMKPDRNRKSVKRIP